MRESPILWHARLGHVSHSSPVEGEHTPTIIQLILSTDLVLIQLKDLLFNSSFSQQSPTMNGRFKELAHKETDSIVKSTLEKKLHQDR